MRRFVKTIGKIVCSLAIVACSMIPCVAQAADKGTYFKAGELYYHTIAKNRVEVCGTTRNEGTLTIPSKVAYKGKSYTVTQIADHENYYQDAPITEDATSGGNAIAVTLPGSKSFRYDRVDKKEWPSNMEWLCSSNISEVVLPSTLNYIGKGAFGDCNRLKKVTFASSYKKLVIGEDAFGGFSMKSIRFPKGTSELRDRATGTIRNIYIPASVKKIGMGVVNAHTRKVEIDSKNKCFKMKDGILYSYNEKTLISASAKVNKHVVISDKVTKVMPQAFAESRVRSVKWNNRVKVVPKGTFYHCSSLRRVTNTDCLTKIEYGAFACCWNLRTIGTVPNVTDIGRAVFWNDSHLTFNLTAKAVNVDVYAFAGAYMGSMNKDSSMQITVAEDNPIYSIVDGFLIKTTDTDKIFMMQVTWNPENIVVPEGITEIGVAIGGDRCTKVILPKSLKVHNGRVCINAGTVQYQTAEVPKLGRYFRVSNYSMKKALTILVPKGTKERYIKAINDIEQQEDGMDYFDELHQIAEYE